MSKKYIYMLFIFVLFLVTTSGHFIKYLNVEQVKEVFDSNDLMCKYSISNIIEKTDEYDITAYYPVTEVEELNKKIMEKINLCINDFKNEIIGKGNSLTINFNSSENDIYTSFVFDVVITSSSAHNKECTFSINYNNKEKKVITIDDILKSSNCDLKNISNAICKYISENKKLKEIVSAENLKAYFDLDKEKYNYFYFDKNMIVFYFNPGTIAPEKSGIIYISVPMDKIN